MNYQLHELIEAEQEAAPEGRTLAVKRGAWKMSRDGGLLIRLRLINAPPGEYISKTGINLTSGMRAETAEVEVDERERVEVTRQDFDGKGSNRLWSVDAFRYTGHILVPEQPQLAVVGVDVPNERATGFLHVLEGERAAQLFPVPPADN